jgi:hypothetical protein
MRLTISTFVIATLGLLQLCHAYIPRGTLPPVLTNEAPVNNVPQENEAPLDITARSISAARLAVAWAAKTRRDIQQK